MIAFCELCHRIISLLADNILCILTVMQLCIKLFGIVFIRAGGVGCDSLSVIIHCIRAVLILLLLIYQYCIFILNILRILFALLPVTATFAIIINIQLSMS